jgi:hypothetical protein
LPFLVCFISGSRDFVRFLVDGGAAIKVASTIVPWLWDSSLRPEPLA